MGLNTRVADLIWSVDPAAVSSRITKIQRPWSNALRLLKFQSEVFAKERQIRCWWPRQPLPGNLGDLLTPIILKELLGLSPVFSPRREFVGVGSIINRAFAGSTVWGSGILNPDDNRIAPGLRFLAVRGPLTWAKLRSLEYHPPDIFGDPAILLPRIYTAACPQLRYRIGYIGHYSHRKFSVGTTSDVLNINVLRGSVGGISRFIDALMQCNVIASSSLHGIVLAIAYRKPFIWVELSEMPLKGGAFKFTDFFHSIGRLDILPKIVSKPKDIYAILNNEAQTVDLPDRMADDILQALNDYIRILNEREGNADRRTLA